MVKNKKRSYLVPALDRGLDVLEWMARQPEPVTLTGIAQGLNLAVSEVQRPVSCLLERGYLHRQGSGGYILTGLITRLASTYPPHWRLQQAAFAPMAEFSRRHAQSVHLSVPDGDGALLLLDVPGGGLVRLSLQQGARLDREKTVSGRLMAAYGCLSVSAKDSQKAALRKIARRGYEVADSTHAVGIVDVGVPVRDAAGQVVAALTVSCLRLRQGRQRAAKLVPHLLDCSHEVGKAI
jgi:DNA-binding IclR family transcriptional regulator